MTLSHLDTEIQALAQAAGITRLTERRALTAEDVDRYLESGDVIGFIAASSNHQWAKWIASEEIAAAWQQTIRPNLGTHNWEGWYDAYEWRSDEQALILVFVSTYVPI